MNMDLEEIKLQSMSDALIILVEKIIYLLTLYLKSNPNVSSIERLVIRFKEIEEDLKKLKERNLTLHDFNTLRHLLKYHSLCLKLHKDEISVQQVYDAGLETLSELEESYRKVLKKRTLIGHLRKLSVTTSLGIVFLTLVLSYTLYTSSFRQLTGVSGNIALSAFLSTSNLVAVSIYIVLFRERIIGYIGKTIGISLLLIPLINAFSIVLLAIYDIVPALETEVLSTIIIIISILSIILSFYVVREEFKYAMFSPITISLGTIKYVEETEVNEEELYERLLVAYRRLYGEAGEEILKFEINILRRRGLSPAQCLVEISRRLKEY